MHQPARRLTDSLLLSLRNGEVLVVDVSGPLIVDNADLMIRAAIDGLGLTFSFEEHLALQIASGALVRVLGDWCAVRWLLSLLSESAAAARGAHGADRHASLGGWPQLICSCRSPSLKLSLELSLPAAQTGPQEPTAAKSLDRGSD